jgi:hypothetical protein
MSDLFNRCHPEARTLRRRSYAICPTADALRSS